MRYFTLQECIHSDTAKARGIDNTPGAEHEAHIVESIETLIDPLREAWEAYCRQHDLGKVGIRITETERSGGRLVYLGALPRLCLRPRADKREDEGVQALLP